MAPVWPIFLALLLGSDVAPARRELARASTALLAGDAEATRDLEALFAQRPWDDDVAYWLARARYESARCEEAVALLLGRDGRSWPAWRLRTLEAYASVCAGDMARASSLLDEALPRVDDDAERSRAAAVLGLLRVAAGAPDAAALLVQAGGDPALSVEASLRARLPEALGVRVLTPVQGAIRVEYDRRDWRIELASGLARPTAGVVEPALAGAAAPRGPVRPCGDGLIWTSPEEPLADGAAGVFLLRRGAVARIVDTPAGALDDSPTCVGDAVWLIRTVAGTSFALRVEGEALESYASEIGLVSLDARADGALLVGAVAAGRPGVWYAAPGGWPPAPLLGDALALLQPRWAP